MRFSPVLCGRKEGERSVSRRFLRGILRRCGQGKREHTQAGGSKTSQEGASKSEKPLRHPEFALSKHDDDAPMYS